mgnify:CR=1 FL=1
MNKKLLVTTVAVAMAFVSATGNNLEVNAGARGEGIGFAYSAIADDAFGALHNPAGIASSQGWQIQFQYLRPTEYGYSTYLESPYSGLAAARYNDEKLGSLAFNAFQSGSTAEPTSITTTNTVNIGYARKLASFAAFGLGTKYQFETNYGKRKAFDLDAGINIIPTSNLTLALTGENILRSELTPTWLNQTTYLDRKARAAVAFSIPFGNNLGFLLAGYQATETDGQNSRWNSLYNLGSEWWFGTLSKLSFGLRGGYTMGKAEYNSMDSDYKRLHAGFSFNLDLGGRDMRLDYGIRTFPFDTEEDFAIDQFISFSYGFGGLPQQNRKTKQDYANLQTPPFEPTKPSAERASGKEPVQAELKPSVAHAPISQTPKSPEFSEPYPASKPTALPESTKPIGVPTPPAPVQIEPKPTSTAAPAPETPKPPEVSKPDLTAKPATSPETTKPTNEPPQQPIPAQVEPKPASVAVPVPETPKPPEIGQIEPAAGPIAEQPLKPETAREDKKQIPEPPPILEVAQVDEVRPVEPTRNAPPNAAGNLNLAPIEPNPADYLKLAMGLEASNISTMGEKRIVFYIRPERVVKLTSWRLYILKAKLKDWSESKLEADAVHIVEGKGIPPINVIWNGSLKDGRQAPAGKYHFVITGIDRFGQRYISDWCKFGLNW